MPEPSRSIADWRRESQRLNELLERSVDSMEEQLKRPDLLPRTRERAEAAADGARDNGERVAALLREAGLPPDSRAKASDKSFALMEYYDQIAARLGLGPGRADGEPAGVRIAWSSAWAGPQAGQGAGAGRWPLPAGYDLHQRLAPALTVALDINPLLLLVGRKAMFGAA
jgi:hypothetical protein